MKFSKFKGAFNKFSLTRPNPFSKKYPSVLQFPITYKCNSRCKICNIWKIKKDEITIGQFKKIIKDPIFKKIKSVGINGGEPTLIDNLEDYVKAMIDSLPKLKSINVISNGFESENLFRILKDIYNICKKNNIKFDVSISLDGYGKIHDECRGVEGAFEKTIKSINEIKNNLQKYADSYDVACTISSLNADYLAELDQYCKVNNIKIKYRMAVEIRRLANKNSYDDFNAFSLFSAREHIFRCIKEPKGLFEKFRYYSIFNSISTRQKERLAGCLWQNKGITLDPYGNIYYCAVRSKPLGNLLNKTGREIFFANKNLNYRKEILKTCNTCAHDYGGKIYWKNFIKFLKFYFIEKYWIMIYKFKRHFL